MAFYRKLSKLGKVGFFIFLFLNASFLFLLLSPIIPNIIGEYRDNQLLAGCDERIQQYRTGLVTILIQNKTTGLPIQGWNVSYQHVQHEFIFGCNLYAFDSFSEPTYNESYRNYFKQLFNLAVLPFYWRDYESEQGVFKTEPKVNASRDWCLQNNITAKGHPLAWSREGTYPSTWLPLDNDTLMLELLENRITTIVSKYQGDIDDWDVVNEPVNTVPFAHMSRVEYVQNCLLWANASNPSAQLTVNEYGILGHDFGYGGFYSLLSELIALTAPFDVIGMQAHEPRTDWIPATEIWRTLEAYAGFGKPIHITEFAPTSAPVPIMNSWKKGMWSEEAQAEYARRVYKLCFSHPAMGGIIWWDLSDLRSWVEEGGLLNSTMQPKPVYAALDQLINHELRTSGYNSTNASGLIDFRGFYGLYNVSIQNGAYQRQIDIESGLPNQITIEIE